MITIFDFLYNGIFSFYFKNITISLKKNDNMKPNSNLFFIKYAKISVQYEIR